jgi:hypothetical protein
MTDYLTLFIRSLRSAVSLQASKRAAAFKTVVEDKFLVLAETHIEFIQAIRIVNSALRNISNIDSDKHHYYSQRTFIIKELFDAADQIQNIRDRRRPTRMALFEEAKYILENEDSLVSGPIRALNDEQELAVRLFLTEFVLYFTSEDNKAAYFHEIARMMRALRELLRDIEEKKSDFSQFIPLIQELGRVEGALDERWGRVAHAYAEVRLKVVPEQELHTFVDRRTLLGFQQKKVLDRKAIDRLKPGISTEYDVKQLMGEPMSVTSASDGSWRMWHFMSDALPTTNGREKLVVRFDRHGYMRATPRLTEHSRNRRGGKTEG